MYKRSVLSLKVLAAVSVFATSFVVTPSALAIQPTLVEVKAENDGTFTHFYKIKIDETVRVEGGTEAPNPDFFTIFNFEGMVPGSAKQPQGWTFSTSMQGITPIRGGRAVVSPTDIDGIPNLTWSRSGAAVVGPKEIAGFSVRTTIHDTMVGEYGSQVTRKVAGPLNPSSVGDFKEARIGVITTPKLSQP